MFTFLSFYFTISLCDRPPFPFPLLTPPSPKPPQTRSKQAEKERDLALEANRLFKQDFGDKIESLQVEVEQLRKHRSNLEVELRKERERRSEHHVDARQSSTPRRERKHPENIPKPLPESPSVKREIDQLHTGPDDKTSLSSSLSLSHHEDEQDESFVEISQPTICTMCEQDDSLLKTKKQCKNCAGVFCESCVCNELPLPSSILPETVCTSCYSLLLQQYASTPT